MEEDQEMGEAGGTMVTALAWVSRGYAKPLLDSYEPSQKELAKGQKMASKIDKKKEIG